MAFARGLGVTLRDRLIFPPLSHLRFSPLSKRSGAVRTTKKDLFLDAAAAAFSSTNQFGFGPRGQARFCRWGEILANNSSFVIRSFQKKKKQNIETFM